jgi:hypothetical protein
MLGHLMEWFYSGLAGIKQSNNSVAFKNIEIKPQPVGGINLVKASYHSVYGLIEVVWVKNKNSFQLDVDIPANSTATIFIPVNRGQLISMNRIDIRPGIIDGNAVVKIGSGKYSFYVN